MHIAIGKASGLWRLCDRARRSNSWAERRARRRM